MSDNALPTVHDVDVRGFQDLLAPVRQRQQWRIDRLLTELTRAQKSLAVVEHDIAAVDSARETCVRAAARALAERIDPNAHRGSLLYLAQLQARSEELKVLRQTRQHACDDIRQACTAAQLRLEGLSRHRSEALQSYADEIRQHATVEQDRDWLARTAVARSGRRASP